MLLYPFFLLSTQIYEYALIFSRQNTNSVFLFYSKFQITNIHSTRVWRVRSNFPLPECPAHNVDLNFLNTAYFGEVQNLGLCRAEKFSQKIAPGQAGPKLAFQKIGPGQNGPNVFGEYNPKRAQKIDKLTNVTNIY